MGKEFSHFDKNGNAVMVDVSNKAPTFLSLIHIFVGHGDCTVYKVSKCVGKL